MKSRLGGLISEYSFLMIFPFSTTTIPSAQALSRPKSAVSKSMAANRLNGICVGFFGFGFLGNATLLVRLDNRSNADVLSGPFRMIYPFC